MSQLQADKAAVDDRLAAMMAEIQAFKHEAADAKGKSRADRKVKSLRLSPCWTTLPPLPALLSTHIEQSQLLQAQVTISRLWQEPLSIRCDALPVAIISVLCCAVQIC